MADTSWFSLGDIPVWPTLLALAIVLSYVDWRLTFSFFSSRGIPGPRPWPIVGHAFHFAFYGTLKPELEWSRKYGKVYGCYRGRTPFLVVTDPEVLQDILVKNFANFCNRAAGGLANRPMDKGVFFLKDDEWRSVRNLMSPTFSSGKLKQMFQLINSCAVNLEEAFVKAAKSGKVVTVKELFGSYTIDVIAVTAFGLDINSFQNPDNLFLKYVRKIFEFKFRPLFVLATQIPGFVKLYMKLGSGLWSNEAIQFFICSILSTMEERKQHNGKTPRVDFLQLMMNAEADEESTDSTSTVTRKKKLTVDEIIAQAFLFFIAGYETTGSTLQYLAYNLAVHPEYAEKVYREIEDVIGEDEPTYESLSKLTYLDQCLNETLRLQTPVHTMTRIVCNDGKVGQYTVPKGTAILLPYYGIHHDPDTYPRPYEFDPERFSADAKDSRHPMTFVPFGQGPRLCIGMRLALLEAKLAVVRVLRKVRFARCPETPVPIGYEPSPGGLLHPSKPIVIRAELR